MIFSQKKIKIVENICKFQNNKIPKERNSIFLLLTKSKRSRKVERFCQGRVVF